ncbi:unnamed protein product, partial [marine sediment metagenome]
MNTIRRHQNRLSNIIRALVLVLIGLYIADAAAAAEIVQTA